MSGGRGIEWPCECRLKVENGEEKKLSAEVKEHVGARSLVESVSSGRQPRVGANSCSVPEKITVQCP